MHNKIKALLYTVLIIAGVSAFLTACFWYPMFILNALAFACGAWATYMLYTGLVAHFNAKDKDKHTKEPISQAEYNRRRDKMAKDIANR